jgi:hypothetical protein
MAQRQWRSDDTDKWLYGFGDGSDGDLTISADTTEAPIDSSCSGTSGTTSLSATNASFAAGQLVEIHQTRGTGAGGWELNKIDSYTAGTITLKHALTMTYTDSGASQAQVRVLKQYNNVVINSGVTYTAKAWNGDVGGILGWFAKTGTTITGNLSVIGRGHVGGARRLNAGYGFQGEGTGGAGGQTSAANGNSGGGGGTPYSSGGGGGNATEGVRGGANDYGKPGAASGNAALTSKTFGGSGGGAANNNSELWDGSNGSGIVDIFSKDITITGSINLSGVRGNPTSGSSGAGGGAGAGGSCLLKFATATLGTNLVIAPGGAASAGGIPSGSSSVGRIHIDYSGSYTGTTSPTLDATNDLTIIPPSGGAFFMLF